MHKQTKESRGKCLLLHVLPRCRCDGNKKEKQEKEKKTTTKKKKKKKKTRIRTKSGQQRRQTIEGWEEERRRERGGGVSAGFAMCSTALVIAFLQASLGCNSERVSVFSMFVHQTSDDRNAERDPLWRSGLQRRHSWVVREFW